MEKIRTKFVVQKTMTTEYGPDDGQKAYGVELRAVYGNSPENKKFFKSTPNGLIAMELINEATHGHFVPGEEFYVDFTRVHEKKEEVENAIYEPE